MASTSTFGSTTVENYQINSLEGDDDIDITGGINATGGADSFLVLGGGPGNGSDTLNLIGATADGAQIVAIRPDAIESDDQDIQGFGTDIDAVGIELITYTGDGVDDRLNVELGDGDNVARVTRGVNSDLVTSDSLPNIEFEGLNFFRVIGQAGSDVVTFVTWELGGAVNTNYEFDGGANDSLIIEGTDGSTAAADDVYVVRTRLERCPSCFGS